MARTKIAGALVVVLLASCSVEEPKQSRADQAEADLQEIPVTTVARGAAEHAGLRADFNAP